MSPFGRFVVLVLGLALFGPAPRATGAEAPLGIEDGALAPADCWTTEGGCPARTCAAATRAVAGPVVAAWEQTVKGEIEAEPLVWGRTVLVSSRDKDDLRWLTAIALPNGKVLGKKSWRTSGPLLANVWNGTVVLRSSPQKFDVLRLREDGFQAVSSIDAGAPIHDLLFFQREIYARVGDAISRFELGARTPTWTAGERCRGRIAMRGQSVYAEAYDGDGNCYLWSFGRKDGAGRDRRLVGYHQGGRVPDVASRATRVQAFESEVLVHEEVPVNTSGGGQANCAAAPRTRLFGDSYVLGEVGLRTSFGEAAAWPTGWIGSMASTGGAPELWGTTGEDGRHWVLATMESRPDFAKPPVPPSAALGSAYFGASAVSLSTKRVEWTSGEKPIHRTVPARETVLVATGGGKLVALREPRPAEAAAVTIGTAPVTSVAGRVVLRDGSLVAGMLRVKAGSPLVVEGTPPRSVALEDVLLAEDGAGTILLASPEGAADAVELFATRDTAKAYAALAVQSIATRDRALMERLLGEAAVRGADAKDLSRVESQIKELSSRASPPAVNAAEAAKVRASERDVAATAARVFWERCDRLPADAPRALVLDLLQGTLEREPAHAAAGARVRSMLPAGIVPPEPFDAADWLSFLRALEFTPVTLVQPPTPTMEDITPGQRMLGMYLGTWRRDLVALQSRQLLVISAPVKPGRIANCISAGELVCSTLETLFAAGKHVRDHRWPMTIVLFENRDEYLKVLGRGVGEEEQKMLEWSCGQYSAGCAQLYLPADAAGFHRVMQTFVHELTHQWLAERCPLYSAGESPTVHSSRGHFVVEGFADMMEETRFDLVRRTSRFDPAAESLDVVGSLREDALLPWKSYFALTWGDFQKLSHENVIDVRLRRSLSTAKLSAGHLFYAQGAATCHYLLQAENGKRRQALLEYAAAYYAGHPPTIEEAFGMGEEELGRRVTEFARSPRGE